MQLCMILYLLLHMKLCCLLSAPIREGFLISSVECSKLMLLRTIYAVQPVYYGHIETIQKCTDYQGVADSPGQFTSTC